MADIREFKLPGVGMRYEFTTRDGRTISVVSHRSGRREILTQDQRDPDSFKRLLDLDEEDARTISELIGGSRIAESLEQLQQKIEGLAIDWLPLRSDSPYVAKTIGDARVRTRTGVSIVAVLRDDEAFPAPDPHFVLQPGDYLVVVGTPRGIESVVTLLHTG